MVPCMAIISQFLTCSFRELRFFTILAEDIWSLENDNHQIR